MTESELLLDTMKYQIFGHPRLLMRGLGGANVEIGLEMSIDLSYALLVGGQSSVDMIPARNFASKLP